MTDTIIIYDTETLLPKYTVEAPYPETTLTFYENLVSEDSSIGLCLSPDSDIRDKCIQIVGETKTLISKPIQTLTTELVGNVFTINGIQPFSKVFVDNEDLFELDDQTSLNITLSTYGNYHLVIIAPPYQDAHIEIVYGPDPE